MAHSRSASTLPDDLPTTDNPYFLYKVTLIAAFGGVLFGYDLGVVGPSLPLLADEFVLNNHQKQVVVSVLYLGSLFGAVVGGSFADKVGRRVAILWTDVAFGLGALVLYSAGSYAALAVGRVVMGVAVSISGIADVAYLTEISPPTVRGAVVSVNEACISLGFLLAFGLGSLINSWRQLFGLSGVLAVVQFAGMLQMPESPVWLRKRGREDEAQQVYDQIHTSTSTISLRAEQSTELTRRHSRPPSPTTYQAVGDPAGEQPSDAVLQSTRTSMFMKITKVVQTLPLLIAQFFSFLRATFRTHRPQAWVAFFLASTQMLCGQTIVLSYVPDIFSSQGHVDDTDEMTTFLQRWNSLMIGLVKFIVTLIVIWKIERIGRRFLLLSGISMIVAGQLLLSFALAGAVDETAPNTRCFVFGVPGVLLVVCGYSMSYGPLTWLLTSEIFPPEMRGRALGASSIVTSAFAWLTTLTFLSAKDILGLGVVFFLYALVSVFGLVFAHIAIPETSEKDPEEIAAAMGDMAVWRDEIASLQ